MRNPPTEKSKPTSEPLKRAIGDTMRAIAADPELEVLFSSDRPSLSGHTARLPEPSRRLSEGEIAITRGIADAMALKLACHDPALHLPVLDAEGVRQRFDHLPK